MTLHATKKMRDEYRLLLQQYRKGENRTAVANRHPFHAQIAVSELFEFGAGKKGGGVSGGKRVEALIVTGTAPDRVFCPSEFTSLEKFLSSGGNVRMVIWNESLKCGDRFRAFFDAYPLQMQFRVSQTNEYAKDIAHFLLVADQAYRLESLHDPFGEDIEFDNDFTPEIPAKICFNDVEGGAGLRSYFEQLWQLVEDREMVSST